MFVTVYGIPVWAIVVGFFLAASAGFFALAVLAAYFERRPVWPYAPIGPDDAPAALTYHRGRAKHFEVKGFEPVAAQRDAKGRLYKVRYEFWLAPERDVLAMVGAGKVAGMDVQATWLYTPLADGRMVVSTDQQAAMEPAPGDPWDWGLLAEARTPELLVWHRERVANSFGRVEPFEADPARTLDRMARLRVERVGGFVARGLARHRDDEGKSWSYTALGSLRLVFRTYFKGMFDAITQPFRTVRPGGTAKAKGTTPPPGRDDQV